MNKKDRRIRLFLEFFFLLAAAYTLVFKAWGLYLTVMAGELFDFQGGTIPVFDLLTQIFSGLAALIASWALWLRASWAAGWGLFTMGLLLYGNVESMGPAIYSHPAKAIPMVVIVLVVMQSFPFLIRNTHRHHRPGV